MKKPYYGERTGVHPQRHLHVAVTCKGDQLIRYDPKRMAARGETRAGSLGMTWAHASRVGAGHYGNKDLVKSNLPIEDRSRVTTT